MGRIIQEQTTGRINPQSSTQPQIKVEQPSLGSSLFSLVKNVVSAPFTKKGRENIKEGFIENVPGAVSALQQGGSRLFANLKPKNVGVNILPRQIQENVYSQISKTLDKKSAENRKLQNILTTTYGPQLKGDETIRQLISDKDYVQKYIIGGNLPSLVIGGIGAVAGAPLGPAGVITGAAAPSFLLEGGYAINEAKDFLENSPDPKIRAKADDQKFLDRIGFTVGTANAILEALPFSVALKKSPIGNLIERKIMTKVFNNILVKVGTTSATEGATESLQEIVSNSVKQTYDENQELFNDDVILAGIGGAVLGGGLGVAGEGVTQTLDFAQREGERISQLPASERQRGSVRMGGAPEETFINRYQEEKNPLRKVLMFKDIITDPEKLDEIDSFVEYNRANIGLQSDRGNRLNAYAQELASEYLPSKIKFQGEQSQGEFITTKRAQEQIDEFPFLKASGIDVQAVDQIITRDGAKALGSYMNGVIKFVQNPKATTIPHEAGHAFFDLGLTQDERSAILTEIKDKFPTETMDDMKAEEKLMSVVEKWYVADDAGKESILSEFKTDEAGKSFIRRILDKLKKILDSFRDNVTSVQSFIESLQTERSTRKILSNKQEIQKFREEFYQNPDAFTLKYLKSKDLKNKKTASYEYLSNLIKATNPKKGERLILEGVLNSTQFKDQKNIDLQEFENALKEEMLIIKPIESNTYATYGLENISVDTYNAEPKTVIINTNFTHGVKGHFGGDFDIKTTKDDIEIRKITAGTYDVQGEIQTVSKDQWAVVKKDLTEAQLTEGGVFGLFNTEKAAQDYVDNFTQRSVQEAGMLAHYRKFNDSDLKSYNVVEIQSDVFQKDLTPLLRSNEQLIESEVRNRLQRETILEGSKEEVEKEIRKEVRREFGDQEGFFFRRRYTQISDEIKESIETLENRFDGLKEHKSVGRTRSFFGNIKGRSEDLMKRLDYIGAPKNILDEYQQIFDDAQAFAEKYNIDMMDADDYSKLESKVDNVQLVIDTAEELNTRLIININKSLNFIKETTENLSESQLQEIEKSKKFLDLRNVWHEIAIKQAIRESAMANMEEIRIATDYTVANVEGYIQSGPAGMNEDAYTYEDIEQIGIGGDIEVLGGQGIITEIGTEDYTVAIAADEADLITYSEKDFIEAAKEKLNKKEEYTLDEITSILNYGEDYIEFTNEDGETLYAMTEGPLSGNISTEVLAYKTSFEGGAEAFTLEDIPSEDHRNIAKKYSADGIFKKYLEKNRGEVTLETDSNGFTWWTAKITPEDKGAIEMYQLSDESEQKLEEQAAEEPLSKIEQSKMMIDFIKERVDNSPAKQLKKFMSRKEGEFLDFKNPLTEKNLEKRQQIVERNKKIEMIMKDSAMKDTTYNASDPDLIRKIIADYDADIKRINELKAQIREERGKLILENVTEKLYKQQVRLYEFANKYPELANITLDMSKEAERAAKKGYRVGVDVGKKVMRKAISERFKNAYDERVSKIRTDKEILKARRNMIRAVQAQFGLSDKDLKSITKRDIRLMTNFEFKQYLDNIQIKSEQLAEWIKARDQLIAQINEKDLDIEPLRKALGLPTIANMSLKDLRDLDVTLEPYVKGDVFLSQRKLETIENTELSGIRTYREAREILAKKLGVSPQDLNNIKISEFDRFKSQSALAEKDPFFQMMVEETAKARLKREAEYLDIERQVNDLAKKRKVKFIDKLVPQQENIVKWFNAEDKSKVELSDVELKLVQLMQDEWIKARDYLIKIKAFEKGRNNENYFTHIRRGILETIREDGVIQAVKEVFNEYQQNELNFNILDQQTGEVMALQKFFQYAMRRSDKLEPSKNVIKAFLTYMRTFKKKQALDEIVPLIDTYAHALSPKETTKTGLLLRGDMVRFTKEWLNNQKGRRITLLAKQNGKIDIALRAMSSMLSLLDIAANLPVSVATAVGEQVIQYQLLGPINFVKAKARALTPKGRRIREKYANIIGKNPWTQLVEPARNVGDRLMEGLYIFFRDANIRRNRNFILGSMTKEEFESETISEKRLAEIKIELGRYGVLDDAGSIVGATPEAKAFTKYKDWAIPILTTNLRNMNYILRYIVSLGKNEKQRTYRAFWETFRMLQIGAFVVTVGLVMANEEDDESLIGQMKARLYQEALTLYSALNPATILSVPRLISFLSKLGENLGDIIKLEKYQQTQFGEYKAGEFKGIKGLQKQFTPRFLKQGKESQEKTIEDVKEEIKYKLNNGELDIEGAKLLFEKEIEAIEQKQYEKRLKLPLDEFKKDLKERLNNKEITVEEGKEELADYFEKNKFDFESDSEESFIDRLKLYAVAIGTDMPTAFATIFHNNRIRKIENGTIIVERNGTLFQSANEIPLEERFSQRERKIRGATKDMALDHKVPIGLGGLDTEKNVWLVPVDKWESWTEVEVYLINKLKAGLIDKKEARDLILKLKKGEITKEEIMK